MSLSRHKRVAPHTHTSSDIVGAYGTAATRQAGGIDWNSVPYINVIGNAYFNALTQIQCECPLFTWVELEPYLWGFSEGVWTPKNLTLPLGDAVLRFKDDTIGHEYHLDAGIIFTEMAPDDPTLFISQHLIVKKDVSAVALTAHQGALYLGSGHEAETDMPQIVLFHSGAGYGTRDILEINLASGVLGKIKLATVYVDAIKKVNGDDWEFGGGEEMAIHGNEYHNPNFLSLDDYGYLTVTVGLHIGADVDLYRSATNVLRTPDNLVVEQDLWCKTFAMDNFGITQAGELFFDADTKIYNDAGTIRHQTAVGKGVIVEQELWAHSLAVDHDIGLGGDLIFGAGNGAVITSGDLIVGGAYLNINPSANPVLNLQINGSTKAMFGHDGTDCVINVTTGHLVITTPSSGKHIVLYPLGNFYLYGGSHFLPELANTGCVGNSSVYWNAMYANWYYGKNNSLFGCEKGLSNTPIKRKFKTEDTAKTFLRHELTKEWKHINYGKKDGTIVCTCGKEGVSPCPEHEEEWRDIYTLNTGEMTQASAKLVLELLDSVLDLLDRIETLEKVKL